MKKKYFMWLLMLLVLSSFSCTHERTDISDVGFIAEIENSMKLVFPSSATWLGARAVYEGKDIEYLYCSIRMSNNDFLATFPESQFSSWQTDARLVHNVSGRNEKWFDPDSIKTFKSFQEKYPDSKHVLNVLAENNPSNPEEMILVYVVWWYDR
jgi:hypothetical protein